MFSEKSSLQIIHKYAFFKCNSLTSFNFPPSMICIEDRAFQKCSKLANINVPPSIESIGYSAFDGVSIKNVEIPLSIKNIDGYAFLNPTKVKRV